MSRVHVEEPESLFQNVHFPTLKITHVQLSTVSQCLVSPRNLKSTTDNTQPCTSTKCLTEVNGKVFILFPLCQFLLLFVQLGSFLKSKTPL